ncbi:MAG TPA: RNA-binding S4 domain-containing protein [Bacteroidales bacterium]|nr:RNA-binding S4 domain-containing protein [Bacteroidales bacterium]
MEIRIDKWLWAVRIFKSRSIATEVCKKGRVLVQDVQVKPSRMVKVGDVVQVRKNPVLFSFKILAIPKSRMNAKLVPEFMENVTTPDQLELLELGKIAAQSGRARGTGRPTKKERREMEEFFEPYFLDSDFDDDDFYE